MIWGWISFERRSRKIRGVGPLPDRDRSDKLGLKVGIGPDAVESPMVYETLVDFTRRYITDSLQAMDRPHTHTLPCLLKYNLLPPPSSTLALAENFALRNALSGLLHPTKSRSPSLPPVSVVLTVRLRCLSCTTSPADFLDSPLLLAWSQR